MKRENPFESLLALSGGLILFYLFFKVTALLIIALCLIAIGLFSSFLTSKISWLWLGFAKILGYLSSRLLLGIVFYLILTPLALLRSLLKKKSTIKDSSSCFTERNHEFSLTDFERPF